jgi:hypothetical protein
MGEGRRFGPCSQFEPRRQQRFERLVKPVANSLESKLLSGCTAGKSRPRHRAALAHQLGHVRDLVIARRLEWLLP